MRIAAAADADAELDHESRRGSPDHLTVTRPQLGTRWTIVSELHALPNVEVDAGCQSMPDTGIVCLAILLYGRPDDTSMRAIAAQARFVVLRVIAEPIRPASLRVDASP